MRWFAAEFLVVVTGVLVALALNAWWQGRQDAAREQAYLRQLSAELHETERTTAELAVLQEERVRANAELVRAYHNPNSPPADSLSAWLDFALFMGGIGRPVLGTAEALIATGDLRLIRNDSLRSALTAYIEQSRTLIGIQETYFEFWLAHRAEVTARVDEIEVLAARSRLHAMAHLSALDSMLLSGPDRRPFPLEWVPILSDRSVYNAPNRMLEGAATTRAIWEMMRDQARWLGERLDDEIRGAA